MVAVAAEKIDSWTTVGDTWCKGEIVCPQREKRQIGRGRNGLLSAPTAFYLLLVVVKNYDAAPTQDNGSPTRTGAVKKR